MSASAESRAFGDMMPLRYRAAVTVRPRDALDPHGPTETLFNYAANISRSEAEFIAQNAERREEGDMP